MLKLSLVVEATAPMYGLSIWSFGSGSTPHLQWVEGLKDVEISLAEANLVKVLSGNADWPKVKPGDTCVWFVLSSSQGQREGRGFVWSMRAANLRSAGKGSWRHHRRDEAGTFSRCTASSTPFIKDAR